ncbi:uncharacterized protein LAESUDRAFT_699590 [Laetiporus sulphureus 93-53]|uniref:Uncharacterized protein n=1 Tax=Laetiporus sulphureus 93-53 TaxID=1314785 RepID=A0A165ED23_9APHY|nr:uncharacterized protein LAESUDRAFT_699590 [Laetiporus sulphureus 93-53]KZT06768.1 hypothetical protein LAESUDRAFT_699590 [Laetiporus sulphureus 93-53]
MSSQHNAHPALSTDPTHLSPRLDADGKASYDDLIDQYATYKAYTTSVPADAGRTDNQEPVPLYPLTQQLSNYSEISLKDVKDLDGHTAQQLDWEYPPPATNAEVAKPELKDWLEFIPDSIACRLYLLTVLVETAIDLAIEAELFIRLQDSTATSSNFQESKKMPIYLSIFAMAHVFQFGMALDAVYAQNTLQFIALTIFNALFLFYAIVQIGEIDSTSISESTSVISIHALTMIIPIIISVAELAYIALGWKIYKEFGWKVYKYLGADRRIRAMYAYYQIFLCLVKFDLFFWVGFSVQFIWLVLSKHNTEYYLTCLAFPVSILVLIDGHIAARRENKWMMYIFMTGCLGALVYFMYKLVKVLLLRKTATYIFVWKTLTIFSVIATILLITTSVFAWMVRNNFGRGLANQMSKSENMARRGKSQDLYRGPMSGHPNRMSIE